MKIKLNDLLSFYFLKCTEGEIGKSCPLLPLLCERQIFKGLSIDVAVIAAVPYLHSRTTFHLISMTFHRQPSVPGQGRERARQTERETCTG